MRFVATMLVGTLVAALVTVGLVVSRCGAKPPHQVTMSFVAHPDDDLLFMNPDILSDVRAGFEVWVVVLTDGRRTGDDAPADLAYESDRRAGLRDAYATMARVPNLWTQETLRLNGHEVVVEKLADAPVRIVPLSIRGAANAGSRADPLGDLFRLLHDPTFQASPSDGRSAYTLATLTGTLRALITAVGPTFLRSPFSLGHRETGLAQDHCDHTSAAIIAGVANTDASSRTLRPRYEYLHYGVRTRADNQPRELQGAKYRAWQAYVRHVKVFPGPHAWGYGMVSRQYAPPEAFVPAGRPWSAPTDFMTCPDARGNPVSWGVRLSRKVKRLAVIA